MANTPNFVQYHKKINLAKFGHDITHLFPYLKNTSKVIKIVKEGENVGSSF